MAKSIFTFFKGFFKQKNNARKNNKTANKKNTHIYKAKTLLTDTEKRFYLAINNAVAENYMVLPQINLATIIERKDKHKYQSELYRNIDFVIFNKNYTPILLIEINDNTHKQKKRIARDIKVKEICKKANLPIIAFWTDYGVNQEYINKKISEYIPA